MMSGFRILFVFLSACLLLVAGCSEKDPVGDEPAPSSFRGFERPAHFPPPVYAFQNNTVTPEVFELGRKLFYDKRLSRGSQVSCGSCHSQVHGFADHNQPVSAGVDGKLGLRNSPGLSNVAWIPEFMWDGGINHIEVMPIAPLTDSVEMDMNLAELIAFLQNETEYPQEFEKAFGTPEVNTQRMLRAYAQFMGMMVSADAKYDRYIRGAVELSADEMQGLELFRTHCASCHSEPLFTDFSYRNNGLDAHSIDPGRARITQSPDDHGKFKVPSLRNVQLTNPYMHDGRFFTLQQVLNHYSEGVVQNPNLDPSLQEGIPLSAQEQGAIIAFLRTLTDYTFIADPRFAE